MSSLLPLLIALFRALLPALASAAKDTSEDAASNTAAGDALRKRINKTWGSVSLVCLCLVVAGCFTRTIYVPDGTPVRLREPVKKAKVWVLDNNNHPVEGVMDLPEGWYALSMDKETK